MDRLNPEGVPRDQLLFVLRQPKRVRDARRIDACLLCRRPDVNEAGLCGVCYGCLDGEELKTAVHWMATGQP